MCYFSALVVLLQVSASGGTVSRLRNGCGTENGGTRSPLSLRRRCECGVRLFNPAGRHSLSVPLRPLLPTGGFSIASPPPYQQAAGVSVCHAARAAALARPSCKREPDRQALVWPYSFAPSIPLAYTKRTGALHRAGTTVSWTASSIRCLIMASSFPVASRIVAVAASFEALQIDCDQNEHPPPVRWISFLTQEDETYYVLDAMSWKGYSLYDCTTDFRLFWVQNKLEECGATAAPVRTSQPGTYRRPQSALTSALYVYTAFAYSCSSTLQPLQPPQTRVLQRKKCQPKVTPLNPTRQQGGLHRFRFAQLPAYPATPEGLTAAYSPQAALPFVRDGLHFLSKEANYEPGNTPLVRWWRALHLA